MTPLVSILIPTRNRRELLARTLASLSDQSAPASLFEVVVASDGSSDGTPQMVRKLAGGPEWAGRTLVCVEQEWKGASAARNTALRAAHGDLVLYLDDDSTCDAGLVSAHLAAHERAGGGPGLVVIGHIAVQERPEAIHRELRRWWTDHFQRLHGKEVQFTAFFTANVSMPRQPLLDAGGFDEGIDYGEDVDAGYRLSRLGLSFVYEPGAVVRTHNPKSARAVLRDLCRIGQGNVRIYHKSPETLRFLPLSAYGETSIRMRLAQDLLLWASRGRVGEKVIDGAFSLWAGSHRATRLDRPLFEVARSHYFWRGVRSEARSAEWARLSSPGVSVLTYHSVERTPNPHDRYTVSTQRFSRQMRLLRRFRYQVTSLDSLVVRWESGRLPPPRSIALTFDDGYRDNLTDAWPVLRRLGYPSTLFFVTGRAGSWNDWEDYNGHTAQARKPLLTWSEARMLDRAGFRIESHTVTHPDLYRTGCEEVEREIAGSREALQAELGREVSLFAYPYGHYTEAATQQVERAGYRAAFSVRPGLNTLRTERFALKRTTIAGDDGPLMFLLKVWAGDDPLRYLSLLGRLVERRSRRGHGARGSPG